MNCIYLFDGICCRSTSEHHCNKVDEGTCDKCDMQQLSPDVNKSYKYYDAIVKAIALIEENKDYDAMALLKEAIKS